MTKTTACARRLLAVGAFLSGALLVGGGLDARAKADPAPIRWFIPFAEHGGSDTWARFNAPFVERHFPGQPQVEVVNEPGGGGTRSGNLYTQRAAEDGRSLLGTSGSILFPYILGDLRVRYDYEAWTPVMIAPMGGVVYVAADLGIADWRDVGKLRGTTLTFASQGPTSLDLVPMLAFHLLGLKVRYVFGHQGRNEGLQAMRQGTATVDYQTTPSFQRHLTDAWARGEIVPIMTWGILNEAGQVVRDPTFPDLPTVEEVYEILNAAPPAGMDYDAYRVFATAGFDTQKMLVMPNDVPDAMHEMWRDTWEKVLADPEFLARSPSVLGAYPQVTGARAQELYRRSTKIAPDIRAHVIRFLTDEYFVRLRP